MTEKMPCSISDGPDTPCDQADAEREELGEMLSGWYECGCPDNAEEKCVNVLCPRKGCHDSD